MARGNAREPIFADDQDWESFLDGLTDACRRFNWALWAWCLMGNHYHLLVETRLPLLARGMRQVNGTYTQRFNRRHGRVGHLLQRRYKALLVDNDSYLLELSRYVVLNPVRAELCATAGDWRWSSYLALMGKATPLEPLATTETLCLFAVDPDAARRAYARFVSTSVGPFEPRTSAHNQMFLGGEDFVSRATQGPRVTSREVPRRQRGWKTLAQFEREASHRNRAIQAAWASGNCTLREHGVRESMGSGLVLPHLPA